MTEQIDGNFDSKHFYDTSTVQFGDYLYFFKRIQKYEKVPV